MRFDFRIVFLALRLILRFLRLEPPLAANGFSEDKLFHMVFFTGAAGAGAAAAGGAGGAAGAAGAVGGVGGGGADILVYR